MITTRESINYQFSLIFGYSSPNDIVVGDVIGPGKLTKGKMNQLSQEVITYLRMYNAILRDFTGSELFSIEFELYNYDEKEALTKIFPKSMLLIPGKFKDCESLLLALKPETGYLDTHKSRESINNVSKLFFEVEEFTDHPDLNKDQKTLVLRNFASRFSKKLYGDLLEDKWNKKLIGVSTSLPTEKEMLDTFASIKSDVNYYWNKKPIEIKFSNPAFQKMSDPLDEHPSREHLKYAISEPSANYVVEKTLQLGSNLLNLANTGTIDESKDSVITFIIDRINARIEQIKEKHTVKWMIDKYEKDLKIIENIFNQFLEKSNEFLLSGESGSLQELLKIFGDFIHKELGNSQKIHDEIYIIANQSISQSIHNSDKIRANDLNSSVYIFSEIVKASFKIIKESLPHYLARRRLKTFILNLIDELMSKFTHEQEPAKNIGINILTKFQEFLFNQIELKTINLTKGTHYDEEILVREFKKIIKHSVPLFFDKSQLDISDIISFAEIQTNASDSIKEHIDNFKTFSTELDYLLSYILRYSTINRFLKEESKNKIIDPVTFSNKFHRFLEKRIGGINLAWKYYILEWITDYAKQFFKVEEQRSWTLNEIVSDFINFLEERELREQEIDHFLIFLDQYIAKVSNDLNHGIFLEFYKQFEYCRGIAIEFPLYVRKRIETELSLLNMKQEELSPIEFLRLNEQDTFNNYIEEVNLKYFSKLIPRPVSIILNHKFTDNEIELFKRELFHVFNFKYWGNKSLFEISDNFKEVYRAWLIEE
ncbi:MAG: hypothetical protein KGD73_03445 [Candidatus Lokiarchaeota archaeon]|nr:hypothetical protein [Candidatus Lokiarchaeota archaeon]